MHIFPLPSCHSKGCLGLEADETYAFVGDALYCTVRDGFRIYNSQILKEEIDVLNSLRSSYLLVGHRKEPAVKKDDAVYELKEIYNMRDKNKPEIRIRIEPD